MKQLVDRFGVLSETMHTKYKIHKGSLIRWHHTRDNIRTIHPISSDTGPVWERGQRKRAAYKQNAAPTSLFAILRPHVETSAYSATCGSQTRVQRRPFGGLILCFWLKRIAYAETNMPLVGLAFFSSFLVFLACVLSPFSMAIVCSVLGVVVI